MRPPIVPRVEKAYLNREEDLDRQKIPHCGGPLIYFFLRFDPDFGAKQLLEEMEKPSPDPVCCDIGFQFLTLDRNSYSPGPEGLAIQFLASPKVLLKRGAAEVLGKYGFPAAEKPLWDTLEYFHSYWRGREPELGDTTGQEGIQRECTADRTRSHGWLEIA